MVEMEKRSWQAVAQEAQRYRDGTLSRIQPELPDMPTTVPKNVFETIRSKLSLEEIRITDSSVQLLLEQLHTGKITAVVVANAFLRRAAVAQKLVGHSLHSSSTSHLSEQPALGHRRIV